MTLPAAVLFDMGSTLVRGHRPDVPARLRFLLGLTSNGSEVDAEEFLTYALDLDDYVWSVRSESRFEYSTRAYIALLTDEYGLRFSRPPEDIEREFYFHDDHSEPTPGVERALAALRDAGIRLAVVSNHLFHQPLLSEHLERLGLDRYFEFVISSADYGLKKPDPRIFRTALRRMNVDPADAWFVGDSVEFDVRGAIASGMTPVLYRPPEAELDEPIPDDLIVITDWAELIQRVNSP
jgi:putative hydrolase of the HAD superfamily